MTNRVLQRIFSALVTKGRSSLAQLVHHTALTPRQLRHGLAVLLQHNLLFFYVDATAKTAFYEANADHAYNLIRTGKILEMVETSFGPPAKDVMQNLLSLGQTRISDLTVAYQAKINQRVRLALEKDSAAHGEDGPNGVNGTFSQVVKGLDLPVKSSSELNSVLCRLVEADLVEVVHSKTFQTMDDTLYEVEKEVTALFPGGVKGTKGKMDFDEKVAARLAAIREESKTLKRKLESDGMCRPSAPKRRKLFNGVGAGPGGVQGDGIHENHKEEPDITLDVSGHHICSSSSRLTQKSPVRSSESTMRGAMWTCAIDAWFSLPWTCTARRRRTCTVYSCVS